MNKKIMLNKTWDCFFRVCAFCQSYESSIDLYCKNCWIEINKLQSPSHINSFNDYPFINVSLWRWSHRNSFRVKHLIYSLKEGGLKNCYRRLAKQLYYKALLNNDLNKRITFVPAPARDPAHTDHAAQLAQTLASLFKQDYVMALKRKSSSSQKQKTRIKRSELRFENNSILKPTEQQIIFIDDLITTGSTAYAAYLALKKPKNYQVWTIAEKQLEI